MHISSALLVTLGALLVAAAPAPFALKEHELLLHHGGRVEVITQAEFEVLRNSTRIEIPSGLLGTLYQPLGNETKLGARGLLKRRGWVTMAVPLPAYEFYGWDVAISPVIFGPLSSTVTSGFQLANGITVGGGIEFPLGKLLKATVKMDYTRTWTTVQSNAWTINVARGYTGAIVTQPWTHRERGYVWSGTLGESGTVQYWQADSYENMELRGLSWVNGVTGPCYGRNRHLHRCNGDGYLNGSPN